MSADEQSTLPMVAKVRKLEGIDMDKGLVERLETEHGTFVKSPDSYLSLDQNKVIGRGGIEGNASLRRTWRGAPELTGGRKIPTFPHRSVERPDKPPANYQGINSSGGEMPVCEKCWRDAYRIALSRGKSQTEVYLELLEERKDHPCTIEEQQGRRDEDSQD